MILLVQKVQASDVMLTMNTQAAPAMTVTVTMLVKLLVCFSILALTVSITRSVVLSNVAKRNVVNLQSPLGSLEVKSNTTTEEQFDYTKWHGYIVSNKEERYNHSKEVLTKLGIIPHHYVPLSYKSDAVRQAMEAYGAGKNRKQLTDRYKKVFSNRMAFTNLFREFVDDPRAALDSWRFFFEDDIALHPSLSEERAQKVLARGLEVAARDGVLYLGICGPRDCKKKVVVLESPVEAKQCAGACTHAFGLTKRKTRSFLADMHKLNVSSMYFDQVMRSFGEQVHKIWILGSNLRSPQAKNHYGLVFQDRRSYPSIISAREPQH